MALDEVVEINKGEQQPVGGMLEHRIKRAIGTAGSPSRLEVSLSTR